MLFLEWINQLLIVYTLFGEFMTVISVYTEFSVGWSSLNCGNASASYCVGRGGGIVNKSWRKWLPDSGLQVWLRLAMGRFVLMAQFGFPPPNLWVCLWGRGWGVGLGCVSVETWCSKTFRKVATLTKLASYLPLCPVSFLFKNHLRSNKTPEIVLFFFSWPTTDTCRHKSWF